MSAFAALEQPGQPAFYLSTRQFPQTALTLLVRTAGDPLSSAADLRSAIPVWIDRITFDGATSSSMPYSLRN